jgi:hypothetical protein
MKHFLRHAPPVSLLDYNAGRVTEFWWKNQDISPVDIIPPWLFMIIYHLRDEQCPVGGHISEG